MKRIVLLVLTGLLFAALVSPPAQAVRPSGVTGVSGVGVDGGVHLTWEAPSRGVPETYRVRFRADGDWIATVNTHSDSTDFTVTGLANGTPYVFQVRAINDDGRGNWSPRSEPVTPSAGGVVTPPSGDFWSPTVGDEWQWQLTGRINTSVDVPTFDVDWEDVSANTVATLHAQGKKVICYLSAGSFENWRGDAGSFPASVKGRNLDGWPGEKWLDVRALDDLLPIMEERIATCEDKGFDAVEPDNVDGYTNRTGFPLTGADQIAYNEALAGLAHDHGLGVALKNDVDQIAALEPSFDFALNEECARYHECGTYAPFVSAHKAVLHVEYSTRCPAPIAGFSTMLKRLELGVWRQAC